jgi:integrase
VHVPPNVLPTLEEHLDKLVQPDPDAWLFATRSGSAVSGRNLQREWDRVRRSVDRPDLHLHDLRHAGLTWAAATGATTKELMRRAGHKSPRAALIYQHATEDRDKLIADALGGLAVPTPVTNLRGRQST